MRVSRIALGPRHWYHTRNGYRRLLRSIPARIRSICTENAMADVYLVENTATPCARVTSLIGRTVGGNGSVNVPSAFTFRV
jgi:hypothetical protein